MKYAKLLHNPGAGDENYGQDELVALVRSNGFECTYLSTKKDKWLEADPETDFIIIAGGDGTVRKVVAQLLTQDMQTASLPLALLPAGTANNIAHTLKISDNVAQVIKRWQKRELTNYDVGLVSFGKERNFFLESFGYGIFPALMKRMKKLRKENGDWKTAEEKLAAALQELRNMIMDCPAQSGTITIDGVAYTGNYILAEVMNIRSIGPNLMIADKADPSDGYFDVVLITEDERESFAAYVQSLIDGSEGVFKHKAIRAINVSMSFDKSLYHADDKLLDNSTPAEIVMRKSMLRFLA